MAATPNAKVAKFGASNFEYGVLDANEKIKDTRKVTGLKEVKITLTNELKTLAADDGPYIILSGGITEAKETINTYDVDSIMKKDLYGISLVDGTEVYSKNFTPNYVATLFRTKISNGKHCWVGLLKGMFALPGISTKTQMKLKVILCRGVTLIPELSWLSVVRITMDLTSLSSTRWFLVKMLQLLHQQMQVVIPITQFTNNFN